MRAQLFTPEQLEFARSGKLEYGVAYVADKPQQLSDLKKKRRAKVDPELLDQQGAAELVMVDARTIRDAEDRGLLKGRVLPGTKLKRYLRQDVIDLFKITW